ncbi:MAG TPA: hypothetical protein VJV78_49200 [Polyangiales bacterium]|nr:hypothetical protein [Polyangiales bacterium]
MDALEAELDRLFQLPPSELVGERNALADRLKKAGDKAAAEQIKVLKRPAPAAWGLNQVQFQKPLLIERARRAAITLREAHARDQADPQQLSAVLSAQRDATHAVVEAALRFCTQAGLADGAPAQRKIFATFQSWLSGAGEERPGRMQRELEPSGFDALPLVGSPQLQVPLALPMAAVQQPLPAAKPKPDPQMLARARNRLADAERGAQAARERVRGRRGEQREAEVNLLRAQAQLRELEQKQKELRGYIGEAEAELAQRTQALDEAQRMEVSAEQGLEAARAQLKEAQGGDG